MRVVAHELYSRDLDTADSRMGRAIETVMSVLMDA